MLFGLITPPLTILAGGFFKLDGSVLNIEFAIQHLLDLSESDFRVLLLSLIEGDVCTECNAVGREVPNVQIVHILETAATESSLSLISYSPIVLRVHLREEYAVNCAIPARH